MGPRQSAAQGNEYALLLEDYEIVKTIDGDGLFFLKSKKHGGDYLLREFTFNDKKQYERYVELLQKRKNQLSGCKYVIPLQKVVTKIEDQYCSTFYKIYALFEFTERTLENEINERNLQKRKFQEKQLWSILASCIVGLSHLQKQGIKHQALRSSHILINQDGVIRVFDPIATGCQNNYDTLIAKRSTPHIYLSPELADSLQMEMGQPHNHPYKSDIWTMGMIILEGGLTQYQDECYRDESSRVHWQTIQYNIHRFRQIYSQELTAMLEFMLSREEKNRPDWLELEDRVIKEQQMRMSQPNVSRDSHAHRQPERASHQVSFNHNFDKRLGNREPQGQLLTSNAVNIYSDPNYRSSARPYQEQNSVGSVRVPFAESSAKPAFRESNSRPFNDSNSRSFAQTHKRSSSSAAQVQFRPSNIESTRPYRNMFPSSTYTTTTKVDENLIVVNQEDRFSQIDTPNSKNNGSYYDNNNSRRRVSQNENSQQQSFYNAYTPTQGHVMENRPQTQVTTYGVSNFENREHSSHSYQGQRVVSGGPLITGLPIGSEPLMRGSAPNTQGQSAPEGGEYVVERYKQGSEYKGYKWEDMRHGFGVFYYQDGGMYEGQWRFNRMQGKGKLYYQSGKLAYEGDWVNDQFEGLGKLYNEYPQITNQPLNYRNLDDVEEMWTKYQGEFNGDLKSGRGVLFLTNGEYYEGQFREDYAEGDGVYHCMNGDRVRGRWNKNALVE